MTPVSNQRTFPKRATGGRESRCARSAEHATHAAGALQGDVREAKVEAAKFAGSEGDSDSTSRRTKRDSTSWVSSLGQESRSHHDRNTLPRGSHEEKGPKTRPHSLSQHVPSSCALCLRTAAGGARGRRPSALAQQAGRRSATGKSAAVP